MAFSESISQVIFFIGAVVAAYLVVSSLFPSIQDVANSFVLERQQTSEKIRTILSIDDVWTNSTNYGFYLKNIGYTTLTIDKEDYDVYLNGQKQEINTTILVKDINNNGLFDPGDVLEFIMNGTLTSGTIYKLRVVAKNGAYVDKEFSV